MLAIGYQESNWEHRRQIGGPARGFWQFERDGGVKGVMQHPASRDEARLLCDSLQYPFHTDTVYEALADNDILAAGFARLLLWTDPNALPAIGRNEEAWAYYLRNWRPGKPHRSRWDAAYGKARRDLRL